MNPALQAVKEDPKLPDHYGMEVFYHDGASDKFSAIGHGTVEGILSILTKENLYRLIPTNSIKKIEMDKDYSTVKQLHDQKVMELNKPKMEAK